MEVLYFSLGMLTVALSYAVVSVFKLNKTVKNLKEYSNELAREIATAQDELYRFVDSRVDKLEDRLTKNS
jgi:archaellum component FlaC